MSDIILDILGGASPSMKEILEGLGQRMPLLYELEATRQDSEWHAEGNVLIHTGMVLDEMYKLLDGDLKDVGLAKRAALILAAAFHDIAKPLTTREREIDGRIRVVSPRHEERGRSYMALHLAGELPFAVLDNAMAMTGYHNSLKLLVVRNNSAGSYGKLSRQVDLDLVYWLEVADMRGRECIDKDKQLEHLEMFRMFATDYGYWPGGARESWSAQICGALSGYPSATQDFVCAQAIRDCEAGAITTPEEAIAKSYGYRDAYPEVVLVVGLSGSGKTTWIGKNLKDHEIVSLDDIRAGLGRREDQQNNAKVLRIAKEELREHLRAKRRVVWDATSLRTDFRSAVIDLAEDYGALVTIVAFHCPQQELAKRNKTRKHPVIAAVRLKQLTNAQWPQVAEAHRFLNVDGHGKLLSARGCPSGLPYGLKASSDD